MLLLSGISGPDVHVYIYRERARARERERARERDYMCMYVYTYYLKIDRMCSLTTECVLIQWNV
jgi:hypothetical protein